MGILDLFFKQKNTKVNIRVGNEIDVNVFGTPYQPIWTDRDYRAFVNEGYSKIVWVYAAIREIYQNVASVPWVAYKIQGVTKKSIQDEKLYQKKMLLRHRIRPETLAIKDYELVELPPTDPLSRLLLKPNPHMSWQELMEVTSLYMNISGKCYWERVTGGGKTKMLYPIRPDRIQVVANAGDYISKFQVLDQGLIVAELLPEEMIYFKMPHPLDERGGFSPMTAAARTVDQENAASDWNKAFFDNSAVPKGILVAPNKPDDDTRKALREEWRILHAGVKKAHRAGILWGGVTYQETGKTHNDLEFEVLKRMTREEIVAAWGVPPPLVGIFDHATYQNYAEAKKSLWEETVIPQLCRTRDKINASIGAEYGDQYYLDFDLSEVEALQENTTERYNRLYKAVGGPFLKPNEARQEIGYDPDPAFDNVVYYGMTAATEGQLPGQIAVDKIAQIQQGQGTGQGQNQGQNDGQNQGQNQGKSIKADQQEEAKLASFWYAREFLRNKWDEPIQKDVEQQFQNELEQIKKIAGEVDTPEQLLMRIETEIDTTWAQEWLTMTAKNIAKVVDFFGQQQWAEFNKSASVPLERKWNLWDDGIKEWIRMFIGREVVNVTDTTKKEINLIIRGGFEQGIGLAATVSAIDNLYLEQIIPNRSSVIARTETHAASMAGAHFAAEQTGVGMTKTWVSSRDSHVRDSHRHMDGHKIGLHDLWSVNGSLMRFPGDTSQGAAARETIHCRCDELYEVL